jgi:hypothetical protein
MGSFPSRSGSHIEDTLVGLWREGNDGEERGGGLEHVVAGEILRCSTCSAVRFERAIQ